MGKVNVQRAVLAVSNGSVIDQNYTTYGNSWEEFRENVLYLSTGMQPYVSPLRMRVATPDDVAILGNNISVNDWIAVIGFNMQGQESSALNDKLWFCGASIQFNFMDFKQGRDVVLQALNFTNLAPNRLPVRDQRRFILTPLGGVNTITEVLLLPAGPPINANEQTQFAVGPNSLSLWQVSSPSDVGYIYPLPIKTSQAADVNSCRAYSAIVIVAKDMASYPSTAVYATVSPFFSGYGTVEALDEILN